MKLKSTIRIFLFVALSLVLMSWGRTGHRIISLKSTLSYNAQMDQFLQWTDFLVNHSSDPDDRRATDPDEAPKHFIDIDSYPEFNETGKISTDYSEDVALHGEQFVIGTGILPWATLATVDSLTQSFRRQDWPKAMQFAADLGHYVADGHMPLHITKNYNGQFTGNTGIHSRYESGMINDYQNDILYGGEPAEMIDDPTDYVFNYLYDNYRYVDSVLIADNLARQAAGNTTSSLYYQTLWNQTSGFTIRLFAHASYAFASLLYTAWINAGSPQVENTMARGSTMANDNLLQITYGGFLNRTVRITWNTDPDTTVNISVYNSSGRRVETLVNSTGTSGTNTVRWHPANHGRSLYFVVLKTEKRIRVRKIVI